MLLPSRFVGTGVVLYVVLELTAALLLQGEMDDAPMQSAMLMLRILELLGFGMLIGHFRMWESLGLLVPQQPQWMVLLSMAAGCCLVAWLLYMIQPDWFALVTLPVWLSGITGLLLMVVLAPVVEEIIFRGFVYRMLREQWGVWVSVAVSSVFFSLLHHGLIVSPQLVGGIIFALAYEWTKSLWVPIALHMGANGAVYVLSLRSFG